MLVNNCVSALAGLIPFAGDVILAVYKANSRNAALLEEFLRIRGEEFMKAEKKKIEGESGMNCIEYILCVVLLNLTVVFSLSRRKVR